MAEGQESDITPLMTPKDRELIELGIRALRDTYENATGAPPTEESLRGMVQRATEALKGRVDLPLEEVNALLEAALFVPSYSAGFEYSRRQVARWFEVALDEFEQTAITGLQPDVLLRHMYYETELARWFQEWGYKVRIGEELEGVEGTEFVPDLYAELGTLHGSFQVAVSIFCTTPPNTWRVLAMLESIEAFAPKGSASEFGERDVFFLVTPSKFLEQASSFLRAQAREEEYYVVPVEGNDLQDLEHAADSPGRMERLQDLVRGVARAKAHHVF